MKKMSLLALILVAAVMLESCTRTYKPIRTMDFVDLDRFMGKWYVIANIPTFIEKHAVNATETYKRNPDGTISTTFQYRKNTADGPLKTWRPTGFVRNRKSNAIWGMQFIWPFKADYRILYVDAEYQVTVIGRIKRDYVWIMARKPSIETSRLDKLKQILVREGYDLSRLQMVKQVW